MNKIKIEQFKLLFFLNFLRLGKMKRWSLFLYEKFGRLKPCVNLNTMVVKKLELYMQFCAIY
jgi:hypothetical protein